MVLGCLNVLLWGLKAITDSPSTWGTAALIIWAAFSALAIWQWRRDIAKFKSNH